MFDVIVIGAGAAGLMCAYSAAQRGKHVLLLDKANKLGKKILMSGGGRCNFTNVDIQFENYLCHNPHFIKSALSCYTQWDFIALVNSYAIDYEEKKLGQLFCVGKASQIVDMLLKECEKGNVTIKLKQTVEQIRQIEGLFSLSSNGESFKTKKLVIATGGLSIPTMGASAFGYEVAKNFGLKVRPTRAGLVPFTTHERDKKRFEALSGISVSCQVTCNHHSFIEDMLFTHRGLSGPAMLQISSYWHPGDPLDICLLPEHSLVDWLTQQRIESPNVLLRNALSKLLAKRLVEVFFEEQILGRSLKQLNEKDIDFIAAQLQQWQIKPNATEGYRTAEVTLGGVDTDEVSSKTFESKQVPGLYFIGEVLDVTGWLGGYNFQWAWSSAKACAKAL